MESNTSKIVLAVIVTAIIVIAIIVGGGVYYWQNKNSTNGAPGGTTGILPYRGGLVGSPDPVSTDLVGGTYSSEKYSFKYPNGYSVSSIGGLKNAHISTTVSKGDTTKLEIFKASEYPKDVQARSAKEYLMVDSYDVWLYYSENDIQSKNELKAIFDSIVVK